VGAVAQAQPHARAGDGHAAAAFIITRTSHSEARIVRGTG
jgi:hypothetical protein